jgi:hypothetical protein
MIKGIWFGWFVVFNATFNNISVISWQSVLLVSTFSKEKNEKEIQETSNYVSPSNEGRHIVLV